MATKQMYETSSEVALNLFKDCLTSLEQVRVARELYTTVEDIEVVNPSTLERAVMVYLRG